MTVLTLKTWFSHYSPLMTCIRSTVYKTSFVAIAFLLLSFSVSNRVHGQKTWTGATNNNWNVGTNWSPAGVPMAADAVIIADNSTVSLNIANAQCASLQIGLNGGSSAGSGTIVFNLNSQLTVSGAVTIGGLAGNNRKGTITMAAGGTLLANSLTFSEGGNGGDEVNSLTQGIGSTVTVSGAVTINQPGSDNFTHSWNVNNGTATVGGLINFAGTNSTASRIGQIAITTGTLNANGGIAFAGATPTTKVITIATGTLNIGGSGIATSSGGTLTTTAGTVDYNGSAAQVVGGYSYGNLTLSGGGEKTLAGAASVSGTLTLTDGNLVTATGVLLTLGTVASASGGSKDSFIDGPMAKTGSTAFTFDVGDAGIYAPVGITALVGSSTFTAEYFRATPTDPNDFVGSIDHISGVEYWDVAGGVSASVILSWRASSSVTNLPSLTVAHYAGSTWQDRGNASTTGNAAAGTITSNSVTTFSPFTLASTLGGAFNPLPVELLSFTAQKKSKGVLLEWETATEVNNAFFQVERSLNGKEFDVISKVEGVGNSDITQSYQLLDENPGSGINYYRLKQVDFDGAFEYHPIVSVDKGPIKEASLQLFPNPSIDKVTVILPSEVEGEADLVIYNALGQLVKTTTIDLVKGNNNTELDIRDLAKGRYTMVVNYGGQRLTQAPLMIQK